MVSSVCVEEHGNTFIEYMASGGLFYGFSSKYATAVLVIQF